YLDDEGNPKVIDGKLDLKDEEEFKDVIIEFYKEKVIIDSGDSQVMLKSVKQSMEETDVEFKGEEAYQFADWYESIIGDNESRIQRYYITRINRENGEIGYITIERFDELPRARVSIDEVNGYEDSATARGIVARLNQIDGYIGGKFEYYDTRRDENTFPNLN